MQVPGVTTSMCMRVLCRYCTDRICTYVLEVHLRQYIGRRYFLHVTIESIEWGPATRVVNSCILLRYQYSVHTVVTIGISKLLLVHLVWWESVLCIHADINAFVCGDCKLGGWVMAWPRHMYIVIRGNRAATSLSRLLLQMPCMDHSATSTFAMIHPLAS